MGMFDKHPEQTDLKSGVLVIYEERRGAFHTVDIWCKVTKITPKGQVTVTWSSYDKVHEKVFRPPYRDLRIPTAHEIAVREWKRRAPECELLKVYKTGFGYRPEAGYRLEVALDTDELPKDHETVESAVETIMAELKAFKTWYMSKPVKAGEEDE